MEYIEIMKIKAMGLIFQIIILLIRIRYLQVWITKVTVEKEMKG